MRAVDLFAGCGGLSLGFQNAGFNIVAAFDNWEPAVNCYKNNFKHPIYQFDLRNTKDAAEIISKLKPDIICGGPPCQDFSHAGKRREGCNADLTKAFALIINEVLPEWFVMENVDRSMKSEAYKNARRILINSGYGITERVLDASYCGVPQRRKRFFCIGKLGEDNGFLNECIDSRLSEKPMTVREYLGDELGVEYYYRHPRNYNRRGIFSIDEAAPTVRGVNRPVPEGYKGHPADPVPVTSRLRPLTTLERARIQTFPPDYIWQGSKTDLEQMIGNAVPVKLAEFVATAIIDYLSKSKRKEMVRIA